MSRDLLDIADRVVALAKPGEQIEAVVVHDHSTEARAYDGAIEWMTSAEARSIGVRVIDGARQGFAWAGTLDDDVVLETLAEARDNAAFGSVDEYLGLASPDGVEPPSLELYRDALVALPTERKLELALELEAAVRNGDPRIVGVESADYADSIVEFALASTAGVRRQARESSCWLTVYALASDGTETTEGFGFAVGRDPAQLDVAAAARDAVERSTRLLGASKPPSGRLTVVLDPWVTAQLLSIIGGTLTGDEVAKGRSLFGDRLGEVVASPLLTLVDDPTDPRALGASELDGEGLACRRNELIVDGQLRMFLHNTYSARRMGARSTGSAVRGAKSTPGVGAHALALAPGTATQQQLLEGIDHGLLVQDVSGLHSGVNPVSGDFSTGAEGVMIRNGALAEPVRELTIASTLQRLLLDVQAVGGDVQWLPMNAAGVSLVVGDVTMSGA